MKNAPAKFSRRSPFNHGFTLVEILVVIAIIAILAGVALPSITGALKKAKESTAMQTGRGIALGCFQFANDNDQTFPGATTTPATVAVGSSTDFFNLIYPSYVSNPDAFYLPMAGKTKFAGGAAGTKLVAANICWDATVEAAANAGLNSSDADATPLVISTGSTLTYGTVGTAASATGTVPATVGTPFGTDGVAVALKDGSAFFKGPSGGTATIYLNTSSFIAATTYNQLKP